MGGWPESKVVADIRREVFFMPDGRNRVYGSLYAATSPKGRGVIVCPSIGIEFIPALTLAHAVARGVACAGGAGIVLHPPGHGDSEGEPEDLTVDSLASGVGAALSEAVERVPSVTWGLAGVRMGAAPAAIAASSSSPAFLLLIDPVLDAADHLAKLERSSHRAALGDGGAIPGWAFGYPLPRDRWVGGRDRAIGAVRSLHADTFCVAYTQETAAAPSVRTQHVPGSWTLRRNQSHEALAEACIRRLSGNLASHAG